MLTSAPMRGGTPAAAEPTSRPEDTAHRQTGMSGGHGMTDTARELVVVMTHGADDERSSVAFTIANGGITAGLEVLIFLTSAAVDLVRKRAIDMTHVAPLEPLAGLVRDFLAHGGALWACTPCVQARGYEQGDLIDGVAITGSSVMHERIKAGAATLSF